jgi:hypothetical protein
MGQAGEAGASGVEVRATPVPPSGRLALVAFHISVQRLPIVVLLMQRSKSTGLDKYSAHTTQLLLFEFHNGH